MINNKTLTEFTGDSSNENLESEDSYEILGVSRNADKEDIREAYKKLALKYHPDKCSGESKSDEERKQAGENFKKINKAYKQLTNDKRELKDIFDEFDDLLKEWGKAKKDFEKFWQECKQREQERKHEEQQRKERLTKFLEEHEKEAQHGRKDMENWRHNHLDEYGELNEYYIRQIFSCQNENFIQKKVDEENIKLKKLKQSEKFEKPGEDRSCVLIMLMIESSFFHNLAPGEVDEHNILNHIDGVEATWSKYLELKERIEQKEKNSLKQKKITSTHADTSTTAGQNADQVTPTKRTHAVYTSKVTDQNTDQATPMTTTKRILISLAIGTIFIAITLPIVLMQKDKIGNYFTPAIVGIIVVGLLLAIITYFVAPKVLNDVSTEQQNTEKTIE